MNKMAGIFRKNDIRINGAELTPENIDLICESTIVYLQENGIKELLIGNDMQVTSELFKHALTSRALSGGIDVTLIHFGGLKIN